MALSSCRAALRAAAGRVVRPLIATVGVLTLAACGPEGQPSLNAAQLRGATVAFESIDGPPSEQFNKLVQDLNDEAQTRRLAVVSRDKQSAYRVRGYLSANVGKQQTVIDWVWDVFDNNEHRALRITGTETAKGKHGWAAANDDMLKRIARSSMDQLTTFLISPEVAPSATASAAPQPQAQPVALTGWQERTPEAAGIFRIFRAQITDDTLDESPTPASNRAVPLPRNRPSSPAAVSAGETVTLSALREGPAR